MERLIGLRLLEAPPKRKQLLFVGRVGASNSKNMRTVEHYHRTAELSSGMRSQLGKGISAPTSCWSWCWLLIKTFRVLLCWLLKTSEVSFPTMSLDFCLTAGWSLNSSVPGVCQYLSTRLQRVRLEGPWHHGNQTLTAIPILCYGIYCSRYNCKFTFATLQD